MTINEIQDELIDDFSGLDDWMDRYALIISMGGELPSFPEGEKKPENIIEGCQSRVWLTADKKPDGTIDFAGDSDALIVKGLVAMLLKVYSGHTADEILDSKLYFPEAIGLQEHLSPTRSNGLVAMLKQIHNYALAFKAIS